MHIAYTRLEKTQYNKNMQCIVETEKFPSIIEISQGGKVIFTNNIKKARLLIDEYKTVGSVRMIGVTKYLNVEDTELAITSGIIDIGENRLQSAEPKILAYKDKYPDVCWHFIGHLQSNKAKKIVKLFDFIHSIESFEKLQLIDDIATKLNKPIKVMLQVDISGEESKQGMTREELLAGLETIKALKTAQFSGLMTMAPLTEKKEELISVFKNAKNLANELEVQSVPCPELSMGMSNDYTVALAEGSTMLRLGTVLFLKEEK